MDRAFANIRIVLTFLLCAELCRFGLCLVDDCSVHEPLFRKVYSDLEPWMGGVYTEHLEAMADHVLHFADALYDNTPEGYYKIPKEDYAKNLSDPSYPWGSSVLMKIVVINNTFYSSSGEIPPSPHADGNHFTAGCFSDIVEQMMELTKHTTLPDMVFFVSSGDFPLVHGPSANGFIPPVFSSSGGRLAYDLIVPDCYHLDGDPKFDEWIETIDEEPDIPYKQKLGKIIGRYNLMCPRQVVYNRKMKEIGCPRVQMHKLTSSKHNAKGLLDAGLYRAAKELPDADAAQREDLPYISTEEQRKYKYYLNLDGGTTAFRTPRIMAMGQTMLQIAGASTTAFYTDALLPWEHYVPVARDNYTDIFQVVTWLNDHPEVGKEIADNSKRFAKIHLVEHGRKCYLIKLLTSYAELQKFNVGQLSDYPKAVPLKEALSTLKSTTEKLLRESRQRLH